MADNTVQITLSGKDDTGAAYTSATAREKAFQALSDQTTRKEIAAHQAASSAETQHLKTTKLLADAEDVLSGKFDNTAKTVENTGSKMGAMSMPGGGMGLLVAAAVGLAPVIASVGFGLGGLGLAAAGAVAPVLKAAQATGGLRANMSKLNPEQQAVAKSLLSLQVTYDKFEKSLAPVVLKDFGAAISAVKPLLKGLEPVAAATGKALVGVFQQIGGVFKSGQWQEFFGFMAREAGPDLRMLGGDFANFAKGLPGVIESLKPVSDSLMGILGTATQLTNVLGTTSQALTKAGTSGSGGTNLFGKFLDIAKQLGPALMTGGVSIAIQHMKDLGGASSDAAHGMSAAAKAAQSMAQQAAGLSGALTKLVSPLLAVQGSTVAWRQAQQSATAALKASNGALDGNSKSALAARAALIQSTQAALSAAQAQITLHHNVAAASGIINAQIGYLQAHAGHSRVAAAEIMALVQSEARLPKNITSKIHVDASSARDTISGIQRMLSILDGKVVTTYVSTVFVKPGGTAQGNIRRASGGIVGAAETGGERGGLTWVGEQGPELVRLPMGSTVYPSGQSHMMAAQGARSGGNNYHISVTVAPGGHPGETGRQIVHMIREFEKGSGSSWRK